MVYLHCLELILIAYLIWCIGKQGDQITRLRGAVFNETIEQIMKEG